MRACRKKILGDALGDYRALAMVSAAVLLGGCATSDSGTIGSLHSVDIEIKEEYIDGSLEKALASYQRYLQETPESGLTPEAMRRIADLKIKQAHRAEESDIDAAAGATGTSGEVVSIDAAQPAGPAGTPLEAPKGVNASVVVASAGSPPVAPPVNTGGESDSEFEARVSAGIEVATDAAPLQVPGADTDALLAANTRDAIALYRDLLAKYPLYDRNDQVIYQLSRAYEESGQIEEAVAVLRQLVAQYPDSRHLDEAWFRLGEYYFTRRKYLDAEEAYGRVVGMGVVSSFYELALYKRGWALFKQDMYEMALDDYVTMLDYKLAQGYDLEQQTNEVERKHVEDTFRVISLSFSYLGGAESVVDYFSRRGERKYESYVYSHLGEYYLNKRRYQDAAKAYDTFVQRNPLHRVAPDFSIRIIEIYQQGGFPKLVLDAKKEFATTYALQAPYWEVFDIGEYGLVVEFLQSNLIDLAGHYHAAYQNKRLKDKKGEHYREAIHWYRAYLASFGDKPRAADMNYQLAGLMLENGDFHQAAQEYERTAYDYPAHKDSSEAGYAAVYAYRQHMDVALKDAPAATREPFSREIIRSSLAFADSFPQQEKAPQVLLGAVEDLYGLKDFTPAIANGRLLLERFPAADSSIRRSAWITVAHASFETGAFADAEGAYGEAIAMTGVDAEDRAGLIDNLAASIYQQGDRARGQEDYAAAAQHFLRIRSAAPGASILATAEYDAAAALIAVQDWQQAAGVLRAFRQNFPDHELIKEVTKKLAVVYQEAGELLLAAAEFERIERESGDEAVRREALTQAADLYQAADSGDRAMAVWQRYVQLFPSPLEPALETRQKIADLLRSRGNTNAYLAELRSMVAEELEAGDQRTERTRYLAGHGALVLAEPSFEAFTGIRLVNPIEQNLNLKRTRMKAAVGAFSALIDYQVADVTAAATYYLGEIYLHFSLALKDSERPGNLSPLELEEYELALEEQIYPFEERAISVHEKNVQLLGFGIYNDWIEKSIAELAALVPARYARLEQVGDYMQTLVPGPVTQEQPQETTPALSAAPAADEVSADLSRTGAEPQG
ncbi:tetratricopeptide repeat protein [Microbulbifer sp. TYP-18]|uniref:tetratricopeptide repeat protein n=1 Tax=Microbulbifer sp. TYP-18 TaxID=3230024 RepID=UPI0034C66E7F